MEKKYIIRKLTKEDVEFRVNAVDDDLPVRGNAQASGNDEDDREVEDGIIDRLEGGDVWAWALVTVTAHWKEFVGQAVLGGCSYKDEAEFISSGGYYDQMCEEALKSLNDRISSYFDMLSPLRVVSIPSMSGCK